MENASLKDTTESSPVTFGEQPAGRGLRADVRRRFRAIDGGKVIRFGDLTRSVYSRIAGGITRQQLTPALRDLEDIFGQAPPRMVRYTPYVIVAVMVAVITVASIAKIDIIVTAGGKLIADAPPIVLQPMQLALIRSIRVKAGDVVRKGDELATLDSTITQADQSALISQRDALQAEIDRLEAELSGQPLSTPETSRDTALQLSLYRQRQSQYASRIRAFDEDLERLRETIEATAINDASLAQQLGVYRKLEDMHAKLFARKVEAEVTFLDATVVRMRTERDKKDSESRLAQQRHDLQGRQAERQVFIDQWRSQLLDDLVKARKEAKAVTESLVKADHMNDMVVLKAPDDGIVLEVAKRSVGSVLQAAEPLITLVPTNAPLIADIMINSADVGYVKAGDEVVLKIDAFPYQRFGLLDGRLRAVGEDSSSPGGMTASSGQAIGNMTHRSQVELTRTTLKNAPANARLIPGMTLTAEVKAGTRSIISYFLYPITRGLNESIREP